MYDPSNVYRGRYKEFIESCTVIDYEDDCITERHHIVPKCVGGTNDSENFINLSPRNHFVAHKILAEENPELFKLVYAYWILSNSAGDRVTPEEYEESRRVYTEYLRISMRGNTYRNGKPLSDDAKRRISVASTLWHSTIGFSEESKNKMSAARIGKPLPESTRRKIAEASLGNKSHLGHTHSEEVRARISASHKGLTVSEDTKRKISESLRGVKFTNRIYTLQCSLCGKEFSSKGSRGKYCPVCREKYKK